MDLWAGVFALASVVAAGTAAIAWQHRRAAPAVPALAATLGGITLWSASAAVCHTGAPLAVVDAALTVWSLGIGVVMAALVCLCRSVADPRWRPSGRTAVLLAAEPLLLVLLTATNPWHGLLFSQVARAGGDLHLTSTPLLSVHAVYSYALLTWAVALLVRRRASATGLFRRQLTSLLVAATFPVTGNVLSLVLSRTPGAGVDYTPVCFLLTALVDAWVLLRQDFGRLVPVARGHVVDTLGDAVLVLDPAGLILDLNPAGHAMLRFLRPRAPEQVVGADAVELLSPRIVRPLAGAEERWEVEPLPGFHLDVRATLLSDRRGRALGRVVVARDVTDQHAQRSALERANGRLEQQLTEIEHLRRVLAREATTDALTGLPNRRHLDRALTAALSDARASGRAVGLAVLDVDHFKGVNDAHGHAAGDAVLVALARRLQEAAGPEETVARLGGEEFVVLLPGLDGPAAHRRAETLRRAAAVPSPDGAITLSAGVALALADGDAPALLAAADAALYRAKRGGRDRTCSGAADAAGSEGRRTRTRRSADDRAEASPGPVLAPVGGQE